MAEAREWPIIFSAPMVRAILDGRKTQTRRLPTSMWANVAMHHADGVEARLWVREAHGFVSDGIPFYRADPDDRPGWYTPPDLVWKPSIHMPRWASRITLRVKAIGLVRLQDISGPDARAEGSPEWACTFPCDPDEFCGCKEPDTIALQWFQPLWNTLHTKPGDRWEGNPEVYRIAFERID